MWIQRPEVRQGIVGRVLGVSVPNTVRKLLVWTDRGFYKIVFLQTARSSRLPRVQTERFDPSNGTIRADGRVFTMYGQCNQAEKIYTPPGLTVHPAGDRIEPDPETNTLKIIGPDDRVRQTITHFHAGSEPWAMASFTPDGATLVVADPRGVRLFGFSPDAGEEPSRWQAAGNKADRDALVRAIIENADEDTPRLILADWLEEHGDADRAEFIRLQVRRGYGWIWSGEDFRAAYNRERVLWGRYGDRWLAELPVLRGLHWTHCFRGFAQLRIRNGTTLAPQADAVWAASPVEQLAVDLLSAESAAALAGSQYLERIRGLTLGERGVHMDGLRLLLASPRVRGLRTLWWGGYSYDSRDEGVQLIAKSPNLISLESLSLGYGNTISEATALALARATTLPKLKQLQLPLYRLDQETVRELKVRFPSVS